MDKNDEWTIKDEINDVKVGRPHVVLLGAGASVAALPDGDKNGRKLPVMDNFVEVVGLEAVLKKHGIANHNQNFETLYSDLIGDPSHARENGISNLTGISEASHRGVSSACAQACAGANSSGRLVNLGGR